MTIMQLRLTQTDKEASILADIVVLFYLSRATERKRAVNNEKHALKFKKEKERKKYY